MVSKVGEDEEEQVIDFINTNELAEVAFRNIRLRKKFLTCSQRLRILVASMLSMSDGLER